MAKTVFILGAGASKQAGAPLMNDFLDVADDLHRGGKITRFNSDFESVFKARSALQVSHSKSTSVDLYNMEAVFSAFEMGRMIGRLGDLPKEAVSGLGKSYRRLISSTLEKTVLLPVQDGRALPPRPYQQFVELLNSIYAKDRERPTIITFNYDVALDYALYFNHQSPDYRLGEPQADSFALLKLHGSLNWKNCPECKKVVPWHMREFFQKYNAAPSYGVRTLEFDIGSKLDQFQHCGTAQGDTEPVIVPPTWNKSAYQENLEPVWKAAGEALSTAENIYIVGYSLPPTDTFFHYLFSIGLMGEKILRRLWVFDLNPEIEARYRNALGAAVRGRFQFFTEPFENAISRLKP